MHRFDNLGSVDAKQLAVLTPLTQPSEGAFQNPAPASQPATMPCVAHCTQGRDATGTHSATDVFCAAVSEKRDKMDVREFAFIVSIYESLVSKYQ